jgi:hypothetical protein
MKLNPQNVLNVFFFLILVPYLVPQEYFPYKRVFPFDEHILFCVLIYIIGFLAIKLGDVRKKV